VTEDEAKTRLAQWALTDAWVRHTNRRLGNIIGAPEPSSTVEIFNTCLDAYYLTAVIRKSHEKESILYSLMKAHRATHHS
jgi:hypothetical protein